MEWNGQLKANEFLQIQGHPKVVVAENISIAGPWGTVVCAGEHATCTAANSKLGQKGFRMQAQKLPRRMSATTMGAGCLPGPWELRLSSATS